MQRAVNLLAVEAALSRLDGKPDEAAESHRAALAMGRAMRSDPSLIAQMIACGLDGVATVSIQNDGALSGSRLASLVDTLDPASARAACGRAFLGEVYGTISGFLKWKNDPKIVEDEELRLPAREESSCRPVDCQKKGNPLSLFISSRCKILHVHGRKDYFGNQTCLILQYITHSIGLTSPTILLLFYLLVQRNLTDVHTTFGVVNMKIIVRALLMR